MVDFTQFFNPSAWGSWAPGGPQNILPPIAQTDPSAAGSIPAPMGGGPAIPAATAKPLLNSQQANMLAQMGMAGLMPKPPPTQNMAISMAQPAGPGHMPGGQPSPYGMGMLSGRGLF